MKKNSIWKTWAAIGALAAITMAGGIMAYFTDTDEKVNEFVVGKISIELQEPEWDKKPDTDKDGVPDEVEFMRPAQSVTKDPQVANVGSNDAYLFLTVEVPCRELITVNADGTRNASAMTQLYTYAENPAWKCIGKKDISTQEGTVTAKKYLYAYAGEGNVCTIVKPSQTTAPLFEKTVFANVMEGQGIEEQAFDMTIHAYGIQTSDLDGGITDASGIWQIISNQKELADTYQP
jgi:predicted ribosomally synthesized peptide with SipW-like signal peptide